VLDAVDQQFSLIEWLKHQQRPAVYQSASYMEMKTVPMFFFQFFLVSMKHQLSHLGLRCYKKDSNLTVVEIFLSLQ